MRPGSLAGRALAATMGMGALVLGAAAPRLAVPAAAMEPMVSQAAQAPDPRTPKVGDPAPLLQVDRWLKGTAVARFVPDHVYLVDIWAPWCGPCVGGMAHLTELQRRYRDRGLVVIGLTGPDEHGSTLAAAEKVLAEKRDAVGYAIAWDTDGANYKRWMAIEHDQGWPWSFLVDRHGMIAYSGHPDHLDAILDQVIDGSYDLGHATEAYRLRLQALDVAARLRAAGKARDWTQAEALFQETVSRDGEVAAVQVPILYREMLEAREPARAAAFGRHVVDRWLADDAVALDELSATILEARGAGGARDLELALSAANRAVAVTGGRDGEALAGLARVQFARGDRRLAIATQEKALKVCEPEDQQELAKTLAAYQKAAGH